jgi:hypothetical protein
MPDTSFGNVIFAEEISEKPIKNVIEAASKAGLDVTIIKEIKPRNLFIRAIRKLQSEGKIEEREKNARVNAESVLCDRYRDDEFKIEFQFSTRFLEESGVRYAKAAVVSFDKDTHTITCEDRAVLDFAQKLYDGAKEIFTTQDINSFTNRVVHKAGAKKLILRSGVYWLPNERRELANKLRDFYRALGFSCFMLTASDQERDDLVKAATRDVVREVQNLKTEIQQLKANKELTPRIAKNRIKELSEKVKQYMEIARSLKTRLSTIFKDAGEAGEVLESVGISSVEEISARIQRGDNVLPVVAELFQAAELVPVTTEELQAVSVPDSLG